MEYWTYPDLGAEWLSRLGQLRVKTPVQLPFCISAFPREDCSGKAAQHQVIHPILRQQSWRNQGMKRLEVPLSQSMLEEAQLSSGVGICSVGKPTKGGKTFCSWNLHFLTTANKEITPFSSLCVLDFDKNRIYTDAYKLNIEI